MRLKCKLFNCLFFFTLYSLYAQKSIDHQQLLWVRYNLKLNLNQSFTLQQEFEERTYWFPWRQHQFLSRTHLEKSVGNNWKLGVAFAYLEQSLPNNPNIKNYDKVGELRPQLEISNCQNLINKLSLEHRFWMEFKFFEQSNNTFDFGYVKTRYRLEFRYELFNNTMLKVFDEIHLNLGQEIVNNVFDQNRYGSSIQIMTSNNLGFELGYLNLFQQKQTSGSFYNRDIIRFTIHNNFNLKKSKKQV